MSYTVAIVGCGAVARNLYLKPLKHLEAKRLLRVTELIDPLEANARALAAEFPEATVYADLETVAPGAQPDIALVLSSAHLHVHHAITALERNSHVLCEKPMATSFSDCVKMCNAAKSAGRILAIATVRRFFPSVEYLRNLINSGALGELHSFNYREGRRFDWDITTPAPFQPRGQGGTGVLFDIGPHCIDMLLAFLGPLEVCGYADDSLGGVESNLTLELRSSSAVGRVQLSWDFPLSNELRLVGSKAEAVLKLDHFDRLAVATREAFKEQRITHTFPADLLRPCRQLVAVRDYQTAILCQLVQFLRAIRLDEPMPTPAELGRDGIFILENALRQAHPLASPWLTVNQREAYYALHWTNQQ